ncbi:MAG: hypothetical protein H6R22_1593 [Chromatiaceae bacterium]|nr:hypothetical protein [Chromatiaceae bacterium]
MRSFVALPVVPLMLWLGAFLSVPHAAQAETRYVTDQLDITLRAGESIRYKILRMLRSGTPLEVLTVERDKQRREQELATIRHASANVLDITNDRERLRIQVAELTRTRADLEQENRDLKNETNRRWFMIGAGVLGGGVLMGLILPHLRFGRRKSSWGSL